MSKVLALPAPHEFAEETPTSSKPDDKPKLSLEERLKTLQEVDKELYSAIFGRGVVKGKDQVTEAHLKETREERFEKTFGALKSERVTRVLREKAKAMGFINPENVVDLLAHKLTLNEEFDVVDSGGNTTSIDEAITKYAKENSHLVRSNQRTGLGTKKPIFTDACQNEKRRYRRSELKDAKFYAQHEADIMLAVREGRIIDDLS